MLDTESMQTKMVETVYSLSSAGRLSWNEKSRDSFSAKIDDVTVDIDKTSSGEKVTYVLWVFAPQGLAGRIDGLSLKGNPEFDRSMTYYDVLRKTFIYAQQHVRNSALASALDIVEAFREKNSQTNDQVD